MSQQQQQQPEESVLEADGEEIQSIGYENAAELESKSQDVKAVRSLAAKEAKKARDIAAKTVAEEAASARSSSSSQNDICRICHMGQNSSMSRQSCSGPLDLGLLVSACRCRGTVGLVHTKCLERWLTESGHTRCELCGYRYATIRVPRHGLLRSLVIWMKTFVATRQVDCFFLWCSLVHLAFALQHSLRSSDA